MERLERISILLSLIKKLNKVGSWCGETHVQKTLYFLQELTNIPTNFEFVLYKHGPYSFDLHDELAALQAINHLLLEPRKYPYGPSIKVTDIGCSFLERCKSKLASYTVSIDGIVGELGNKSVAELERYATAFYVSTDRRWDSSKEERANAIHSLKHHISKNQALEDLNWLDTLREKYRSRMAL